MHIRGASVENPEEVADGEEDTFTTFFTPQHHAVSPAQSYFSVLNSQTGRKSSKFHSLQDSLDVYHDAFSTLQRPPFSNVGGRKRHLSLGAGAIENGNLVELDCVDEATETTGMLPKEPDAGRVRHASCSTVNGRLRSATFTGSSPVHIGRLSLSTNSLRKKMEQGTPAVKMGSLQKMGSSQKLGSLQKLVGKGNGGVNYMPCVEMADVGENTNNLNIPTEPVAKETYTAKPLNNEVWMKNYVCSVEAEMMLGQSNGPVVSPQEIQLCPGSIEQSKDTIVQMYTFKPVQRRRVGLQRVRDEFRRENLKLEHKAPHLFVSSQWQQHNRMSCLFLGYRLFVAMYFSMWAVWAWIGSMGYDADISQKKYFMLYMTNWGIWTLVVDTVIQAVNVILHFKKISEEGDSTYPSMTRLMCVSWVLSNITGSLHIFITLAYWLTVYPYRDDEQLNEIGFNTHIMPGVYILVDSMVSATPRRFLHVYQPALFLATYALFNFIYYLSGGLDYLGRPALYPVLDWTQPGRTLGIITAVLLLVIPMLHGILCGLYAARIKIWRILKISRYVREDDEIEQVEQGSQEQKV